MLYRKNIGSVQQVLRIGMGLAACVAGYAYFQGLSAWAICAGGAVFALTGIVGYCPMCTVAGFVSGKRHD